MVFTPEICDRLQQSFCRKFFEIYTQSLCSYSQNIKIQVDSKRLWSEYVDRLGLERGGRIARLTKFRKIAIFDPAAFADLSSFRFRFFAENHNLLNEKELLRLIEIDNDFLRSFMTPKKYIFVSREFAEATLLMGGFNCSRYIRKICKNR